MSPEVLPVLLNFTEGKTVTKVMLLLVFTETPVLRAQSY